MYLISVQRFEKGISQSKETILREIYSTKEKANYRSIKLLEELTAKRVNFWTKATHEMVGSKTETYFDTIFSSDICSQDGELYESFIVSVEEIELDKQVESYIL